MEPSNINNNSEIINQYQYEKVSGEKALNISKDGTLIGKVAAHRTRIHRSQMDEVKTMDGKKYYIKHDEFTTKIGPFGVNIKRNEQDKETHNNNNDNNHPEHIEHEATWVAPGLDEHRSEADQIEKRPSIICEEKYTDQVKANPRLFITAVLLENVKFYQGKDKTFSDEKLEDHRHYVESYLNQNPRIMEKFLNPASQLDKTRSFTQAVDALKLAVRKRIV